MTSNPTKISDFKVRKIEGYLTSVIEDYFRSLLKFTAPLGITEEILLKHGAKFFEATLLEDPRMRESLRDSYPSDEAYKQMIQCKIDDFDSIKTDKSKRFPQIAWDGLSLAVFAYKQRRKSLHSLTMVTHGAGLFQGAAFSSFSDKTRKAVIAGVARLGAQAKLAKDPVQLAKPKAKKLWQDWQDGKTVHKSGAAFARFVCEMHPVIENPTTVERWVRQWAHSKPKK